MLEVGDSQEMENTQFQSAPLRGLHYAGQCSYSELATPTHTSGTHYTPRWKTFRENFFAILFLLKHLLHP